MKRMIALILILCLTLSGCELVDFEGYFSRLSQYLTHSGTTHFSDMEYTRPDMTALNQALLDVCEITESEKNIRRLMDGVYKFYDAYNHFYTAYALSYIHYSADLTDAYWEAEYNYCSANSTEVDAGLDELYYALADSPLRQELESDDYFGENFFDDYDGESIWDETFTTLMEQETELINRYYTLSEEMLDANDTDSYNAIQSEMETLFVSLAQNRQAQAEYLEYDSYMDFAYDYYYSRDYTPSQVVPYLTRIRQELVPLYRQIDRWEYGGSYCREEEMLRYVKSAAYAMGGTVAEAFELLETSGLYDISHSETKYDTSFEIYLADYNVPFVFVNPPTDQSAKLTFAHEFGHFANDYACYGSSASVDVAEFFSQGFEYLSLCYTDDAQSLAQMKMMDCLCIFVEQSAYAAFEHQVYGLPEKSLSEESIRDLFQKICEDYGFDAWGITGGDYVTVPHFFTNPLYVISYVVSNDAAFQLYQLEQAEPGAGLKLYEEQLSSNETAFLAFTQSAGLTSPFAENRIQSIRETLEEVL